VVLELPLYVADGDFGTSFSVTGQCRELDKIYLFFDV
jgi:hypothetical protein